MESSLAFLDLMVLLSLVCNTHLIIRLAISLGKLFQATSSLIRLISLLRWFLEHIRLALMVNYVIHDIFHFHNVKDSIFVY